MNELVPQETDGTEPVTASSFERDGNRNDTELVQACLAGDESAWQDFVKRYARLVYSVPRRYGLSATDADDVFQNVFTIAFRRLAGLREQTRLSAWLITIAHRESMRFGKQQPNTAELDEETPDDGSLPLEDIETWERQHLVHRALEQLGSPCRDLLTALFLEDDGTTYERIAARLGMPIGAIGPTRARCFKKLEAILTDLGFD